MAFCTKCGRPMEDGVKFCAGCGNPTTTEPTAQKMDVTDPRRLTAITVSLIKNRSIQVEGYAQWLHEDVEAMSTSEVLDMLLRIRDTAKRVNGLADKVDELSRRKKQMEKDYQTASKWKNYGWVIGVPVAMLILDVLLLTSESGLLTFLGGIGAFFVAVAFIVMIAVLISGGKWRKNALADYNKNYTALQKEIDGYADAWYADYQKNNHMHISAYKALPRYYCNVDALNYMIMCIQNHRVNTLQQAVNQYEAYKQNETQNRMMQEQIMASERAVTAANRAADASSRAADAARDAARAANNPYGKN